MVGDEQNPDAGLSDAEVEFLDRHSGTVADPAVTAAIESLATSLTDRVNAAVITVVDFATREGLAPDYVEQQIIDEVIYAYPTGPDGTIQLPTWQFVGDQVVPGLARVFNALPTDLTRTEIHGFAFHAVVDHPGTEGTVTIRDWLLGGGDPAVAIELARQVRFSL